jgi:hypothetical protein
MKFILYGVGSFSTLCTVVIFIYLLDTGPAETGSSVSSDAASEPLMPYIALLFGIIFILVFGGVILHLLSARKQSLRLIQTELDEGKRMYKEAGRTDAGRSRAQRGQFKKVSPAQEKSAVAYTVDQRLCKRRESTLERSRGAAAGISSRHGPGGGSSKVWIGRGGNDWRRRAG